VSPEAGAASAGLLLFHQANPFRWQTMAKQGHTAFAAGRDFFRTQPWTQTGRDEKERDGLDRIGEGGEGPKTLHNCTGRYST